MSKYYYVIVFGFNCVNIIVLCFVLGVLGWLNYVDGVVMEELMCLLNKFRSRLGCSLVFIAGYFLIFFI